MGNSNSRKLEEDLEALQKEMQELNAIRDDLLNWASKEVRSLLDLPEVKRWISRVGEIEPEANRLLDESISVSPRFSKCQYSKEVAMTLKQVETLRWERVFEVVAERCPRMKNMPVLQQIVSREKLLERAWGRLRDENVGTLGISGTGGIGKTTVLAQIQNKFSEAAVFDVMIFVVVADKEVENIQDAIGRSLGLQWEGETKKEIAADIFRALKRKRFVLLLDDIHREVVDLKEIGVPYPSRENGCKIVFTTTSYEECRRSKWVDAEEKVEVVEITCLSPEEAWDLFQKTVGEATLTSHPDIPALARIVADKCHGLPLALNVIGETMAAKRTLQEWRYTIHALISSSSKISGFKDDISSILKLSYEILPGEKIKSCFLYCALFPQDFDIKKQDLVNYWVGEGLVSNEIKGYEIIRSLLRAHLLTEDESGYCVKMHGTVREMALKIASDFGRHKEKFVVVGPERRDKMPDVDDWKMVTRMSVTSTQIESLSDSHDCSNLTTLFLRDNEIKSIVGNFFRSMGSLVVLDLSHNSELTELPEDISFLVALRYLSLLGTMIKDLPHGLGKLTQLIHLDLEYTRNLRSISLISGLLKLQVLRLYGSAAALDLSLLEELERLKHLGLLTITVRQVGVLKAFLKSKLAWCTQGLYLQGVKVSVASFAATFGPLGGLHKLEMTNCDIIKSETDWEGNRRLSCSPSTSFNQITPSDTWFKNLSAVVILSCKGLRDLTWLIYAANLESLSIKLSPDLEEIISEEKARDVVVDEPFLKLQVLDLDYLDELKGIYWSPLSFPSLKKVNIKNCPNLHKLPLSSTSVSIIDDLRMEVEKEWLQGVEWENGAKERFFRVIRTTSVSQLHPV